MDFSSRTPAAHRWTSLLYAALLAVLVIAAKLVCLVIWRDAATGEFESGYVNVADMVTRQPWADDVPVHVHRDDRA